MSFHVGQKVVCVVSFDDVTDIAIPNLPKKGRFYHIRESYKSGKFWWVRLIELVNPAACSCGAPCASAQEPDFAAFCFRPVEERKTDISVFTACLDKYKQPERV